MLLFHPTLLSCGFPKSKTVMVLKQHNLFITCQAAAYGAICKCATILRVHRQSVSRHTHALILLGVSVAIHCNGALSFTRVKWWHTRQDMSFSMVHCHRGPGLSVRHLCVWMLIWSVIMQDWITGQRWLVTANWNGLYSFSQPYLVWMFLLCYLRK